MPAIHYDARAREKQYINDPKDGTAETRQQLVELAEDFRRKANILYAFIRCVCVWSVRACVCVCMCTYVVMTHPYSNLSISCIAYAHHRQSARESKEGFCPNSDVGEVKYDAETFVLGA